MEQKSPDRFGRWFFTIAATVIGSAMIVTGKGGWKTGYSYGTNIRIAGALMLCSGIYMALLIFLEKKKKE